MTEELEQKGFSLLEALYLEVDLTPLRESLNEIKKDVILLSFDPNQTPAQERYERPDQPVRIRVWVSPLLENASEEDRTSLSIALREYIQTHTRVYVDVDRKRAPGSNKAEVELELRKDSGWYDAASAGAAGSHRTTRDIPLGGLPAPRRHHPVAESLAREGSGDSRTQFIRTKQQSETGLTRHRKQDRDAP